MAVAAGKYDAVEALLKASDNAARDLEDTNVCRFKPAEYAHDKNVRVVLFLFQPPMCVER